jgi:hypothetical protein
MNTLILFAAGNVVLVVLFWILLILAVIGAFVPDATSPYIGHARWVIVLILLAILGIAVFGNPTT